MGLDITAYEQLLEPFTGDIESLTDEERDDIYDDHYCMWKNPDFPNHAADIEYEYYKDRVGAFRFCAGSYSGYDNWRNWLATIAGYQSADYVWSNITEGPFFELINFSDCEGTIGPAYSAKLYKDFVDHQHIVDQISDDDYSAVRNKDLYNKWKEAFKRGSTGAVLFH